MRMMTEMSRIAADYGLDVWIWYPAMEEYYPDPGTVETALLSCISSPCRAIAKPFRRSSSLLFAARHDGRSPERRSGLLPTWQVRFREVVAGEQERET